MPGRPGFLSWFTNPTGSLVKPPVYVNWGVNWVTKKGEMTQLPRKSGDHLHPSLEQAC